VADLPITLPPALAARLAPALDVEGKIGAALEALGPIGGQRVGVIDTPGGPVVEGLCRLAASVVHLDGNLAAAAKLPGSLDVIVGLWSSFRGVDPVELAAAERLLRPGGRLLVVHDYGRDDVSRLRGDRPEYGAWSHRSGPFMTGGFKIRVVHCFWTFPSIEDARAVLAEGFGEAGAALAATLKRPRLSWNVAVYHRSRLLPSGT
jgi:hypothetical protein